MDAGNKREKQENPRERSNPLSAIFFLYTLPTFFKGFKHDLEENDLYQPLKEHRSDYLGDKLALLWEKELRLASEKKRHPSLGKVIVKCFGWQFVWLGIVLLIFEIGMRMLQPLALGKLISYFEATPKVSEQEAYFYAGGVVACSFFYVISIHPYMLGMLHIGMKMRVACCSLIYRKALRLSKTALGETTAGQVVNLLSNDVNRFDVAVLFLQMLWVGPLETVICTYFMYQEIGVSAIAGVIALLLFIPLQAWLGKRTSILRLKTALRTDERVRLMNEIISGIQVIKMYTWEKPFAKLVSLARRNEIKQIRLNCYIRGVIVSFIMFTTRISIFTSILVYVLLGNYITAEQVFVLTSYYNILRQTMTVFFPQGIAQFAEARVSIKRLEKFLLYDETEIAKELWSAENENIKKIKQAAKEAKESNKLQRSNRRRSESVTADIYKAISEDDEEDHSDAENEEKRLSRRVGNGDVPNGVSNKGTPGIVMTNGSAKWTVDAGENTLQNLNFTVTPGRLVAIIGPVGSGKTSLLHAILKELPLNEGNLVVNGKVSYASQEPWLFAGTVRSNILFGEPMDRRRYREVVKRCALERDFTLLPYGDKTIVGERGVSLSGGQRARINLARAVYREADIYLLDDPLSAVDTHVGKHLFEDCVNSYLRDKVCILITHQLQYLKEVDQILILNNGSIEAEGSFDELKDSGLDFAKLLQESKEEEEETTEVAAPYSRTRQGSIQSIVSSIEESRADAPAVVEEQRASGSVDASVYKAYFVNGGNCCVLTVLAGLFCLAQMAASGGDYFITYWVNLEEHRNITESANLLKQNISTTTFAPSIIENATTIQPLIFVDKTPQNASTTPPLIEMFTDSKFWELDREMCIYIYTIITIATIIVSLIRSFSFFNVCMNSSINLHDGMFNSITRATMRFFNTNSSGRILNRFSKDMGAIDEMLPYALVDCLQIGLALLGIIIVIAIVNIWLLLPTIFVGFIFYLLRIFYLSTSRSVKRLEGTTRSPVFAHLNASLQGLTTIRAFEAEKILIYEFDRHQDLHSGAWYLFIATSRAFGFWLDLVCIIYIAVVTMSFLILGTETFGGNVGLAITQSISLTGMFQWGMRQSTELENQMTSVERVLEYQDLESEPALESEPDRKPPPSWPSKGEVEFRNVYLRYSPMDPPVLRHLSFRILPKQKVGIVGRTGAGKSSLINALFRLTDLEGEILLDGIDTQSLGLHDLRSKISIIPQEPVLFSGTMRKNLDPFDEYSDDVLWRALEEVELKEAVAELAAGLNSKMSEGGTNFSVGQRQLVCLARAIVRNNKVLVLDEATANVDPQTDSLIQTTIRKKFAQCTVLTIAHRLYTVMDSDRVLVMDAGTMVEFDHPHHLLQNKNGVLTGMVNQTGKAMAEALNTIAEQAFRKQQRRLSEQSI
ncbi:ATP-binding cassette sub-family C member 4-like isoform X2 [Chrysoperla carnea]|uniref:ATP-binding cassette sub-family C member 4-like isoform X2 n=1 Tax=Chrysoperla carnea TaxID=189513 RepID=UPI001D07216C|nr:ATP-binding cassette sub-family C member 4-like isoform X2 [Chrysoperla carnea]